MRYIIFLHFHTRCKLNMRHAKHINTMFNISPNNIAYGIFVCYNTAVYSEHHINADCHLKWSSVFLLSPQPLSGIDLNPI